MTLALPWRDTRRNADDLDQLKTVPGSGFEGRPAAPTAALKEREHVSKAFTKENDEGAGLDSTAPILRRTAAGETRYLTPEGAGGLRAELARLSEERSSIRGGAARSEPPRAREIERRLQKVTEILDSAAVAPVEADAEGRALFGAWVAIEDEEGARRTFRIVGPDEADARERRISASSPFGRALLGRKAGDQVTVELPRGASTVTVLSVSAEEPHGP
jgi:transcription elongation factor GreB